MLKHSLKYKEIDKVLKNFNHKIRLIKLSHTMMKNPLPNFHYTITVDNCSIRNSVSLMTAKQLIQIYVNHDRA